MSSQENYAKTINQKFGQYRPVWYPTSQIQVGDILEMDSSGSFNRYDSLATYGPTIPFVPDIVANPASVPIDFVSSSGVSFASKASGQTNQNFPNVPQANAAISYNFTGSEDFTMYAAAATETSMGNILELQSFLLKIHATGQWQNNFIVATKVLKTPVFSLILSESSNSSLEVSLTGTGTPSIQQLGQVGVSFDITSFSGATTKILGATNVTPFVGGMRLVPFGIGDRHLEYV